MRRTFGVAIAAACLLAPPSPVDSAEETAPPINLRADQVETVVRNALFFTDPLERQVILEQLRARGRTDVVAALI